MAGVRGARLGGGRELNRARNAEAIAVLVVAAATKAEMAAVAEMLTSKVLGLADSTAEIRHCRRPHSAVPVPRLLRQLLYIQRDNPPQEKVLLKMQACSTP